MVTFRNNNNSNNRRVILEETTEISKIMVIGQSLVQILRTMTILREKLQEEIIIMHPN